MKVWGVVGGAIAGGPPPVVGSVTMLGGAACGDATGLVRASGLVP